MSRRKRAFDLVMLSGGAVVFAPVMLSLATLIRLEDGGEVLFRQDRVGLGGRSFRIFKLRSMRDGQITRIGGLMRRTGLDEVAQFLNVLRGDMSLVGPRPWTAADLARWGWDGPDHHLRHTVKPGITGLAQLFGRDLPESAALDRAYVTGRDLRIDAELVAVSFVVNALGKGRVRALLQRPAARRLRAVRLAQATLARLATPA
ncbi:MAG: sugar transferase [Deltaproteobacteria bacterium]|nr:sugar transferase [Deltaproteobacteria bacterium]